MVVRNLNAVELFYYREVTTPEIEEEILSTIRPEGATSNKKKFFPNASEFDPASLSPDIIAVECEIGPAVLKLFGSLIRLILHLKVTPTNYFHSIKSIDYCMINCVGIPLIGFKNQLVCKLWN